MFAVFEDGSRQYRVSEGEKVQVDYREAEVGTRLEFKQILLYQNGDDLRIGQPRLEGLRILGEVVEHPSIKVTIQHFRRRKNSRRFKGHRQHYTLVRIRNILLPGQEPPVEPPPQPAAQQPAAAPATPAPAPPAATVPPAGTAPTT